MINYKKWFRDLELMGYVIINNCLNSSKYRTTLMITNKEVCKLRFIESVIRDCIIEDIIEVCREDMESKENTCNPEKVIAELVRGGLI